MDEGAENLVQRLMINPVYSCYCQQVMVDKQKSPSFYSDALFENFADDVGRVCQVYFKQTVEQQLLTVAVAVLAAVLNTGLNAIIGLLVTESARALAVTLQLSSISTGIQTATPPGCTTFDPRVRKCLAHAL